MGETHSTGQRSKSNQREEDKQRRDHIISPSRGICGTQRKQETQEWNSFLNRETTKTHSFLTSSLRNTLNVLERLAHKLSWLPLLLTTHHHETTERESAVSSGEPHPIVASADGLKESLREARQLLEELSTISSNLTLNINPSVKGNKDPNQLCCGNKTEDASSSSDLKPNMHLQGNANLMVKNHPLTQTVVIVPINEWVEKKETIWRNVNDSDDSIKTLRPKEEKGNRGQSLKGSSVVNEPLTSEKEKESRRPLVNKNEEQINKHIPLQSSAHECSPPSSKNNPSLLNPSTTTNCASPVMRPEQVIYWNPGVICETISEEDEEDLAEKSEEELEFEVSACSSPQSDLIFDSFQADDDDERLDQLIDLRDDPDYEALVQLERREDVPEKGSREADFGSILPYSSKNNEEDMLLETTSKHSRSVVISETTNQARVAPKESDCLNKYGNKLSEQIIFDCASQIKCQGLDSEKNDRSEMKDEGEEKKDSLLMIPTNSFYISKCFQGFCDTTSNNVIDLGVRCASGLMSANMQTENTH